MSPQSTELMKNVWQMDVLPFRSDKLVVWSKEDQEAIELLEAEMTRVDVEGVLRYTTPSLFQATKEAVMPSQRSTEKRLAKNPQLAEAYCEEIHKLVRAVSVKKLSPDHQTEGESRFIPHHLVSHNGKHRIVFNCSYQFRGLNLNDALLPGPTLDASLFGVLLHFRQHAVAISGDIRGIFHQVRLLPEDRPLLTFVWRYMRRDDPPDVYEWQVLPFGTTCSPCCTTFALQRHVKEHSSADEDVRLSVEQCFYVDNCLQSVPTPQEAKELVDKLRKLLPSGGFELRQWASNTPSVISHLPKEARSDSLEHWLSQGDPNQPNLHSGLAGTGSPTSWDTNTDL